MQTQELAFGALGDIFNVMGAVGEYRNAQEQGDNGAVALAKGITNFAWGEYYYGGVGSFVSKSFLGKGASMIGGKVGSAVGGIAGGVTGGIGGTVASAFGVKKAVTGGAKALGKAGVKYGSIAGSMIGGMIPVMALTMAPQMLTQLPKVWEHTADVMTKSYKQRGKLGSGYFEMSQAGYTMRQRSLNAIRQNGLNTQSVLGNEARTYFRSSGLDY